MTDGDGGLVTLGETLGLLVAARFIQGAAAAIIMPASLTVISQAYEDRVQRGRAVAIWDYDGGSGTAVWVADRPVSGSFATAGSAHCTA